jgi:predicted TIM-barrel fold metal-dependent hydrolase
VRHSSNRILTTHVGSLARPANVLDLLWAAFGPDRLLFGSNWPIWTRKNSFAGVVDPVRGYWAATGPDAAGKFFHANARAVYGLRRGAP